MHKLWQPFIKIFTAVLIWFIAVHTVSLFTIQRFGITPQYPYYNQIREHLSINGSVWAGFDGIHYLRLARSWYGDVGTQAFFPLYPGLARVMSQVYVPPELTALLVNALGLLAGLIGLYLLWGKKSWFPIIATLVFPTSFFFSAVYTESLFFGLTVLFFLAVKRKHWWIAAVLAGATSGTRIVGCLLGLSLVIAYWQDHRRLSLSLTPLFLLAESGLLGYTYYLYVRFGDPLLFVHMQSLFGRTGGEVVLLPQVLFRYLKMILTVDYRTWAYYRLVLELAVFIGAVGLWLSRAKLIPLSLSVYLLGSLLIPTFTGTLLSLPRFALVLVPWLAYYFKPNRYTSLWLFFSACLLLLFTAVFTRGWFVA